MDEIIIEDPPVLIQSEKRLNKALDLFEKQLKAKIDEVNHINVKFRDSLSERIKLSNHQSELNEEIKILRAKQLELEQKNEVLTQQLKQSRKAYESLKTQGQKTQQSLDEDIDDLFTLSAKEGA